MPLVSVIVPIYQSENYLRRCIDSILSQTLKDIEVLLVDDGSTDRSLDICEDYAQKDSRIRVFSKSHSGVSDTRQMGLENAVGEYVIHCDSDDWMESEMLRLLFDRAKKDDADMVVCDYWIEGSNSHKKYIQFPWRFNANRPLEKQIGKLSFHVWNKLVRRSLFFKYNICFPKNASMAEDVYVVMSLLNCSVKLEYVHSALYHYDCSINENHITANYSRDDIECNIRIINDLMAFLPQSLKGKMNSLKRGVIIKAYNDQALTDDEILQVFKDVHWQIVVMGCVQWKIMPLSIMLLTSLFSYISLNKE